MSSTSPPVSSSSVSTSGASFSISSPSVSASQASSSLSADGSTTTTVFTTTTTKTTTTVTITTTTTSYAIYQLNVSCANDGNYLYCYSVSFTATNQPREDWTARLWANGNAANNGTQEYSAREPSFYWLYGTNSPVDQYFVADIWGGQAGNYTTFFYVAGAADCS